MNSDDIKLKLHALGSDGALETLACVKMHGWVTASDVAKNMDIHIATAVKRLNLLHDAGFLDRRVRKGKTRSAQEYSLHSSKIVLELDLEQDSVNCQSEIVFIGAVLRDMAGRLGRFGGKTESDVLKQWGELDGKFSEIIAWLEGAMKGTPLKKELLYDFISKVLAAEVAEYGELTVRALARASSDSVKSIRGYESYDLPSIFFGGD